MGGVVVETGLEKVVKGVREQGRVRKRGEGGGGLGVGVEAMGGLGMGRGWI